jgi:uncharacterized protein (TIGR02186 family)
MKRNIKNKIIYFLLLIFFCSIDEAIAFSVIGDLSPNQINISSEFKGQKVLVFGALIKKSDNVIIVIHGPEKNIKISKKTKTFGIWTNSTKIRFDNIPQFFSVSYVKDKFNNLNNILRDEFLPLQIKSKKDELLNAFEMHKEKVNLYQYNDNVEIIDNHLFRCMIDFPSNIIKGEYIAEIIALNNNKIIGIASIPLFVNKIGLDSWLFDMHYLNPIGYSILAICGALLIGWLSSFLPKK